MRIDISYNEDVQEYTQGPISDEITLITDLLQKLLSGELDYRTATNGLVPEWIEKYFIPGYGESDWLFDHVGKVDQIRVIVTKTVFGYGIVAKVWLYQNNKQYPNQYRLQFWSNGSKSVGHNLIDTD